MAESRTCRGCGVVVPGRFGHCPRCGRWEGLGLLSTWLLGGLLVLVAVGALAWTTRLLFPGEPTLDVQVTPGGVRLALDERGSEVSATIDNPNPVPVDVTVLIVGH